ncbi:hypothetical protein SAMN04488005_1898 [Yoonia tamlensis]|uniref:Uncharacterized protein n=1 Tax=Yoonia tamlensis TaxID=390270 RepID=A0A1I6GMI5_9RHOB|nr:hypothetical protein [Yoonia tamlensis]SFR43378.1 hypothetical protein SAMN04488005_1898 [Yoonia tamlensis]
MSSRANPESARIFEQPMAAQAGVAAAGMDSGANFRGKQCEVIVTGEGQLAASSGVWVAEVVKCDA